MTLESGPNGGGPALRSTSANRVRGEQIHWWRVRQNPARSVLLAVPSALPRAWAAGRPGSSGRTMPCPVRCRCAWSPRRTARGRSRDRWYSLSLPGAAPLEPAVLREARGRGPHQPLIESERRRQGDQAAEGDGAAPRHDGIAEYGHDERTAAQRPLAAKARDEFGGGGGSFSGGGGAVRSFFAIVARSICCDTKIIDFGVISVSEWSGG